nr:uncharacterized protein LOC109151229 [Ipomoea batatas]
MPNERIRKTRGGAGRKGYDKVDRSEKAKNSGGQRGVMVVPNSTSESTVPKISKGQLTDTVPIQSLPFQQYPTNMIWSIPSSRNSLSSFNEYSYHITGNTSQPMMNVDSPMPPTNNPEDLSAVVNFKHYSGISTSQGKRSSHTNKVEVVANNKMKEVRSTQSQVQSTNTLPGLSSESMPIMNGVYDPMYEELGLPVDPHLRYLMLNPNFIRGSGTLFNKHKETKEMAKRINDLCGMLLG